MTDPGALSVLITALLPFDCLRAPFMQQALLGLLLLAPMAATMGVQVVNFRMAFFADAISHSAFAGVAMGLILVVDPHWSMLVFSLLVGIGIMAVQRSSALSADTVIGVFFSAVVAFGLAVVSRDRSIARDLQRFLYGDILTIDHADIVCLQILLVAILLFQAWGYNRMLYIGLNPLLAKAHKVRVAVYQYLFAGLLSVVVIFAVWAVGAFGDCLAGCTGGNGPEFCTIGREHVLVGTPRLPDLRPSRADYFCSGLGPFCNWRDHYPGRILLVWRESRCDACSEETRKLSVCLPFIR